MVAGSVVVRIVVEVELVQLVGGGVPAFGNLLSHIGVVDLIVFVEPRNASENQATALVSLSGLKLSQADALRPGAWIGLLTATLVLGD